MFKMTFLARPLSAVLLIVWCGPGFADSREVVCESNHNNRSYCHTGRHGDVRLMKQIGWSACEEGQSWGTESEGIWVDNGCRAKFWVDDEDHHKKKDHTGAIVAGVAGAALLGALLLGASSRSGSDDAGNTQQDSLSDNGLAGEYEGFDSHEHVDVSLKVHNDGKVTAISGTHRSEGRLSNGLVTFSGGHEYRIEKTKRGVRLFNTHDSRNVVDMFRL